MFCCQQFREYVSAWQFWFVSAASFQFKLDSKSETCCLFPSGVYKELCLQVIRHRHECELQGAKQHLEVTHTEYTEAPFKCCQTK